MELVKKQRRWCALVCKLSTIAVFVSVLGIATPAAAFPTGPTDLCGNPGSVEFTLTSTQPGYNVGVTTINWTTNTTTAQRGWVYQSMAVLNSEMDEDRNSVVNVSTINTGGAPVRVFLYFEPIATDFGFTTANNGNCDVFINEFANTNRTILMGTARHEMLHALGIHHSGGADSNDGPSQYALMGGCPTVAEANEMQLWTDTLRQDSAHGLNSQHLQGTGSAMPVVSNYGFEQGLKNYRSVNMNIGALNNQAYARSGNFSLKLTATGWAYNSYITQTANVWHGNDPMRDIRGTYWARERWNSDTLKSKVRLLVRRLDDGADDGCAYPSGLTGLDTPTVGGWISVYNGPLDSSYTTTYKIKSSPWKDLGAVSSLNNAEGFVLEARTYGRSERPGGLSTFFRLDDWRSEVKS